MNMESLFGHGVFIWVILPLLIFLARIMDVSLGTMRIVFVSRGLKYLAPLVGFFEVIIWLLAIRVVMKNLDNIACYLAYGAGFATGTYVGLFIEKKLAIGKSIIRIITQKNALELINILRSKGFGVTTMEAEGKDGKVHVIYSVINRNDIEKIAAYIQKFNPHAFYTLEDVQFVSKDVLPSRKSMNFGKVLLGPFVFWRKSK
jgi:uncharacterized protein YebE (UPF0316 family)